MHARHHHAVVRALVVLLTSTLLVFCTGVLQPRPAGAEGASDPLITAPATGDRIYTGFTGPYGVDFTAAPYGDYSYTVVRLPSSGDPVPVGTPGTFTWTGTGSAQQEFSRGPLTAAGTYRFSVDDGAGHAATLSFTVRGPQPRCSAVTPAIVRVNRAEIDVPARLAANCTQAGITYASWDIRHATQGFANIISFRNTTRDSWRFGVGGPLGTYYAVPVQAANRAGDTILQNAPRTVIRLAARASLTAVRTGRSVSLRGLVTRYTPSALAFRGWKAHRVTLAVRDCATCRWRTLATPRTDARGRVSLTVRSAAVKRYRLSVPGTSGVWAPAPAVVRR